MKYLSSLFILMIILGCNSTKTPGTVNSLVNSNCEDKVNILSSFHLWQLKNRLASNNIVEYKYIGFSGKKSQTYKIFEKMNEIATTGQLICLTYDKSAVVASYASYALLLRDYPELYKIFRRFLYRDNAIEVNSGCIRYFTSLATELYKNLYNHVNSTERMNNSMLMKFDSIALLYDNTPRDILSYSLRNRKYSGQLEDRIKKLAFEQHRLLAIHYFSKHHYDMYKDLIKKSVVQYLNTIDLNNPQDKKALDYFIMRYSIPGVDSLIIEKYQALN